MLQNLFTFNDDILIRSLFAFLCALIIALSCGGKLIDFLHHHQSAGQPIREDGPQSHLLTKKGTPTMGGLLILGSGIISALLWCHLTNIFVWLCLLVLVVYGGTGFADDYVKVKKHTPNAMTAKMKLFLQFATACFIVFMVTQNTAEDIRFNLTIPYFKSLALNLFWFYVPFGMFVIAGASNAVNLTDGLDGLASGLMIIALSVFSFFCFICSDPLAFDYHLPYIEQCDELVVLCSAIIGGCLGFLWFNAPKAKIFMGDTGSIALGALLGTIAVMCKQELLLALVGGVFVMETVSVMIQVLYFKKTGGKRFFKMAPIHHHFEQLGWNETCVVVRFWIIGFILAILGLASLLSF
jgi:phospho-N-acetylmuramoyl-pentapeptide-transferase